jgi:hypothetical protein
MHSDSLLSGLRDIQTTGEYTSLLLTYLNSFVYVLFYSRLEFLVAVCSSTPMNYNLLLLLHQWYLVALCSSMRYYTVAS